MTIPDQCPVLGPATPRIDIASWRRRTFSKPCKSLGLLRKGVSLGRSLPQAYARFWRAWVRGRRVSAGFTLPNFTGFQCIFVDLGAHAVLDGRVS